MQPCCMLCKAVVGIGVWLLAGSKQLGGIVPDVLEWSGAPGGGLVSPSVGCCRSTPMAGGCEALCEGGSERASERASMRA